MPGGARRNLAAAGAGALLIAVLGTVVTLGVTSDGDEPDSRNVTTEQTATEDPADDGTADDGTEDVPSPTGPAGDETSATPEHLRIGEPQHLRFALPERLLVERYVADGRADGRGEQHAG